MLELLGECIVAFIASIDPSNSKIFFGFINKEG